MSEPNPNTTTTCTTSAPRPPSVPGDSVTLTTHTLLLLLLRSLPGDGAEQPSDARLVACYEGGGVDDPSVVLVKLALDQLPHTPGQLLDAGERQTFMSE